MVLLPCAETRGMISREHFQISTEPVVGVAAADGAVASPCAFFLTNLSPNCTMVNSTVLDEPGRRCRLRGGDCISLCTNAAVAEGLRYTPFLQFCFDLTGSVLREATDLSQEGPAERPPACPAAAAPGAAPPAAANPEEWELCLQGCRAAAHAASARPANPAAEVEPAAIHTQLYLQGWRAATHAASAGPASPPEVEPACGARALASVDLEDPAARPSIELVEMFPQHGHSPAWIVDLEQEAAVGPEGLASQPLEQGPHRLAGWQDGMPGPEHGAPLAEGCAALPEEMRLCTALRADVAPLFLLEAGGSAVRADAPLEKRCIVHGPGAQGPAGAAFAPLVLGRWSAREFWKALLVRDAYHHLSREHFALEPCEGGVAVRNLSAAWPIRVAQASGDDAEAGRGGGLFCCESHGRGRPRLICCL